MSIIFSISLEHIFFHKVFCLEDDSECVVDRFMRVSRAKGHFIEQRKKEVT